MLGGPPTSMVSESHGAGYRHRCGVKYHLFPHVVEVECVANQQALAASNLTYATIAVSIPLLRPPSQTPLAPFLRKRVNYASLKARPQRPQIEWIAPHFGGCAPKLCPVQ